MLTRILVFHSVLLLGMICVAEPATLYVAPNGSDTAAGTAEAPLATMAGTRDKLRAIKAQSGLPEGAVVQLRDGIYRISSAITFSPEDSGTSEAPIVYRAYPGESPVISGGLPISGWTREGNLWVADLPAVRDGTWSFSALYVNGDRRQPARTPNPANAWGDHPPDSDFFFAASPFEETNAAGEKSKSTTKFHFRPDDLKEWESIGDSVFVIFHSWETSQMRVKNLDTANHVVEFTGPAVWPYGNWQPDQRYFVEHLFEALDQPGEWYLNRKTGKLYYWPLVGETPETTEVIAPVAQQLLVLAGDPQNSRFVEHLYFQGITFEHTEFGIGPQGHGDPQAAFSVNAAVEARGARHIELERCAIQHTGNYAVWFRAGSQHNALRDSTLTDLGAGGVRIGEGSSPATPSEAASHNVIDNCVIKEGGRVFRGAVGVWIGRSSYNEVTHNEIGHFRYTGVSVGWSWGYDESSANHNRIELNHIHDIGLGQLNDMGGIYCLGVSPGTVLRGNVIHDVVSHPRLYGGWGLYTDEGSSHILIENNLVYNTRTGSFHQHYGRDNWVVNNILAFSQTPQVVRSREEDHTSFMFERNIVLFDNGNLLGSTWKNGNWIMDHNLYWDTSGQPVTFSGRSFAEWKAEGHDEHSLIADPLFVDAKQHDFHLKPGSPAIDLGFQPFDYSKAGPRTN